VLVLFYAIVFMPLSFMLQLRDPETVAKLSDANVPMAAMYAVCGIAILIFLAVGGLIIAAGVKMRALKSYGLAMAGAILSCVPCCVGLCCLPGLPIGIWALVVLMNDDVKRSFT
jgi:hypothetical protein